VGGEGIFFNVSKKTAVKNTAKKMES